LREELNSVIETLKKDKNIEEQNLANRGRKLTAIRRTCQSGIQLMSDYQLKDSFRSEDIKFHGKVRDIEKCIELCCQSLRCTLAYLRGSNCYSVSCHSYSTCQPIRYRKMKKNPSSIVVYIQKRWKALQQKVVQNVSYNIDDKEHKTMAQPLPAETSDEVILPVAEISCPYHDILRNTVLQGGWEAGLYKEHKKVRNIGECNKLCCEWDGCNVALIMVHCYLIQCYSYEQCQPVDAKVHYFKPILTVVRAMTKDSFIESQEGRPKISQRSEQKKLTRNDFISQPPSSQNTLTSLHQDWDLIKSLGGSEIGVQRQTSTTNSPRMKTREDFTSEPISLENLDLINSVGETTVQKPILHETKSSPKHPRRKKSPPHHETSSDDKEKEFNNKDFMSSEGKGNISEILDNKKEMITRNRRKKTKQVKKKKAIPIPSPNRVKLNGSHDHILLSKNNKTEKSLQNYAPSLMPSNKDNRKMQDISAKLGEMYGSRRENQTSQVDMGDISSPRKKTTKNNQENIDSYGDPYYLHHTGTSSSLPPIQEEQHSMLDGATNVPELSIVTDDNAYVLEPEKIMDIVGHHTKNSTLDPSVLPKPSKNIETKKLDDEYFPFAYNHHHRTNRVTKKTKISQQNPLLVEGLDKLKSSSPSNENNTNALDAIQLLGDDNENTENANKSLARAMKNEEKSLGTNEGTTPKVVVFIEPQKDDEPKEHSPNSGKEFNINYTKETPANDNSKFTANATTKKPTKYHLKVSPTPESKNASVESSAIKETATATTTTTATKITTTLRTTCYKK